MKKSYFFILLFLLFSNISSVSAGKRWDLKIKSDKEEYVFGEIAKFKIIVLKNGRKINGKRVDYKAYFPVLSQSNRIKLEPTNFGFRYSTKLDFASSIQTLFVEIYQKNHLKKIKILEERRKRLLRKINYLKKLMKKRPRFRWLYKILIRQYLRIVKRLEKRINILKAPLAKEKKEIKVNSNNDFEIKEGEITNKREITLIIKSNNNFEIMVSENKNFEGSEWMEYKPFVSFTLSEGDGIKTVFVKFRLKGSHREEIKSKSIIFDTTAPEIKFLSPEDGLIVSGNNKKGK